MEYKFRKVKHYSVFEVNVEDVRGLHGIILSERYGDSHDLCLSRRVYCETMVACGKGVVCACD